MLMFYCLLLVFFVILLNNILFYWLMMFYMTLVFVLVMKMFKMNMAVVCNYFFLQEILGMLFLFMVMNYFQILVIMLKLGLPPLHFWVFYFLNYLTGLPLLWFLFYNKLPFIFLISHLMNTNFTIIFFGLVVIYLQTVMFTSLKNMLALNSLESLSWMILMLTVSEFEFYHLFLLYFLIYLISLNFSTSDFENLTLIFLMVSTPFLFTFMIKYYVLFTYESSYLILICLLMVFPIMFFMNNMFFYIIYLNFTTKNISLYYPFVMSSIFLFYS